MNRRRAVMLMNTRSNWAERSRPDIGLRICLLTALASLWGILMLIAWALQ